MKKVLVVTAAIVLLCLGGIAQADVFNLGPGLTNLETVSVGDPGNVGELSGAGAGGAGFDRTCGSVSYTYDIGKYEVTAAQYADFLNHKAKSDPYGLYNPRMMQRTTYGVGCQIQRVGDWGGYSYSVATDWANRPVNWVSFWDACRFANWLNNGQGEGDMETGAYTLNGYNGDDGRWIQRNPGARWLLASEDEWYKAAYYKGGGASSGYWDYATQSDSVPSNDVTTPDGGNNANFYQGDYSIGSYYWRTNVGEFENSESPYGAFDQTGNLWEWNDTLVLDGYPYRGVRGGAYYWYSYVCRASERGESYGADGNEVGPAGEGDAVGFRVSAVPEPSSLMTLGFGGLGALLGITRRAKSGQ